jgi:hypothetical protein
VDIKTTSVHQLVKKFGRSIFKNYRIDEKTGKMNYENFKDWIIHHKNLYNDFYTGFHSEVWEINKEIDKPVYAVTTMEFTSKARVYL